MIELLLCALIWGASFVAQKLGSGHFGPMTLNACKGLLAAAFLGVCIVLRGRRSATAPAVGGWSRPTLVGGLMGGLCVFCAESAQQIGIERTTPGVSAFLTANYVLIVPVLAWAAGRGRPRVAVWLGVALALAGSFLLSLAAAGDLFVLGRGELWTLGAALGFAMQILVVARHAPSCDPLRFTAVQVAAAGVLSLAFALLPAERARTGWGDLAAGWPAILYLGLVSGGIAYVLQNRGQAKVSPSVAALVLSMEGVFAAVFGRLALGDAMNARQVTGCALVFAAVLVAQLAGSRRSGERGVRKSPPL